MQYHCQGMGTLDTHRHTRNRHKAAPDKEPASRQYDEKTGFFLAEAWCQQCAAARQVGQGYGNLSANSPAEELDRNPTERNSRSQTPARCVGAETEERAGGEEGVHLRWTG